MTETTLSQLVRGENLTAGRIREAVECLIDPGTEDVERAALLVALRTKGESVLEVAEFARELRRRAIPFPLPRGTQAVDVCGTGGARVPSFNVSTVSAFVVAATGTPVVKHGNRSARGPTGSSDLLEALGLPVVRSRAFSAETFRATGLAFLHAPLYHPATRSVVRVRQSLGVRTVFNLLGPLTNPARVAAQVAGAADLATARLFARVAPRLGVRRGIALTSDEGCDEFSPRNPTTAIRWTGDRRTMREVHPDRLLDAADRTGEWGPMPPAEAAQETERILAGGGGARRGSVLLTSGAALWVAGRSSTLRAGVAEASNSIDSGAAESLLSRLREIAASRSWADEGIP